MADQAFIIEFPSEWYLREYTQGHFVATGDRERATSFNTESEARKALAQARHSIKPKAIRTAKIVRA